MKNAIRAASAVLLIAAAGCETHHHSRDDRDHDHYRHANYPADRHYNPGYSPAPTYREYPEYRR